MHHKSLDASRLQRLALCSREPSAPWPHALSLTKHAKPRSRNWGDRAHGEPLRREILSDAARKFLDQRDPAGLPAAAAARRAMVTRG
jgi:hypothetical protein